MKMGFELNLEQNQKLVMTPELQQAIAILQLSSQELLEYIEEQLLENPVLELKEEKVDEAEQEPVKEEEKFDIDWQEYFQDESDLGYIRTPRENKEEITYEKFISRAPTLQDYLMQQLQFSVSSEFQKRIGEFIIGNLDDNGYLCTTVPEIAKYFHVNRHYVEEVLEIVQNFDPPGIAARDLKECLLNQLESRGIKDDKIKNLIQNHLLDLAEGKLTKVAKSVEASVKDVQRMMDIIKTLDPKPGRWFASEDKVRYVVPDVVLEKVDDEYIVLINDVLVPRLGINSHYKAIIQEKMECDPKTKKFIEGKLNAAAWIIKSIEQRRVTLYKVVKCIVEFQRDFLDKGIKYLKPLNLRQVAVDVGIHESTVSRAISGKFIQTPQGVFQLKFFFASGIEDSGGLSISSHSIKKIIEDYIKEENPKKPYSDGQLTEMLRSQGIKISRRTVAKYRDEMGIPSANRRKRF